MDKGVLSSVEFVALEGGQCIFIYYWKAAEFFLWVVLASGGVGSARHLMDGNQKVWEGLCFCCTFPSSRHHKLCGSPRLNHGLAFNSGCKKVATSWAWYLCLHIFWQCALFLFHYLRAPEEHMLMQRKWLSEQKGHSELDPWSSKI